LFSQQIQILVIEIQVRAVYEDMNVRYIVVSSIFFFYKFDYLAFFLFCLFLLGHDVLEEKVMPY